MLQLRNYQQLIIDRINKPDAKDIVLLQSERQMGVSTTIMYSAINDCINNPMSTILIVSGNKFISNCKVDIVREWLQPEIKSKTVKLSRDELTFENGSRILFRGQRSSFEIIEFDRLYIDNAAFISNKYFMAIIGVIFKRDCFRLQGAKIIASNTGVPHKKGSLFEQSYLNARKNIGSDNIQTITLRGFLDKSIHRNFRKYTNGEGDYYYQAKGYFNLVGEAKLKYPLYRM